MSKSIRILAFGDSLTAGYYDYGTSFHPYSILLTNLLSTIGLHAQIDQAGISGEKVLPSMVRRLEMILQEKGPLYYDSIIILGGTNDIGSSSSGQHIFHEGLKLMYDQVLRTKSQLVVMTVIECQYFSPETRGYKEREDLNDLIRYYAQNHPEKNRIHLVDLAREIPFHSLTDLEQREALWNDGLHLNPVGYNFMAEIIFRTIKDSFARL